MAYSKTAKAGYTTLATQLITEKELAAMSEFIRNFKLKYTSKKTPLRKKKQVL